MATKSKTSKTAEPEAPAEQQPFRSYNRVQLAGRLVADPDLKYTPSGKAVCRMRVATNDTRVAEFHSVVAFDKLAQIAVQYCTKGRQVYVEGKLRSRDYTDADGTRRFVTEVIAETIKLLGAPTRGETTPADVVADSPAPAPQRRTTKKGRA